MYTHYNSRGQCISEYLCIPITCKKKAIIVKN